MVGTTLRGVRRYPLAELRRWLVPDDGIGGTGVGERRLRLGRRLFPHDLRWPLGPVLAFSTRSPLPPPPPRPLTSCVDGVASALEFQLFVSLRSHPSHLALRTSGPASLLQVFEVVSDCDNEPCVRLEVGAGLDQESSVRCDGAEGLDQERGSRSEVARGLDYAPDVRPNVM